MTENFLLNILPLLSGVLLTISYIPQIVTTFRTKNVEGIDRRFWLLISLSLAGLAVSTGAVWYYKGTYGNFVTEFVNVSLAVTMLVLVFKYRKKPKEEEGVIKNKSGTSGRWN